MQVRVRDIAAGGWHSIALSDAGEVFTWGRGEYGRLGLGDRTGSSKLRPQKVRGLEHHRVVQASLRSSTFGAFSIDVLVCWLRCIAVFQMYQILVAQERAQVVMCCNVPALLGRCMHACMHAMEVTLYHKRHRNNRYQNQRYPNHR